MPKPAPIVLVLETTSPTTFRISRRRLFGRKSEMISGALSRLNPPNEIALLLGAYLNTLPGFEAFDGTDLFTPLTRFYSDTRGEQGYTLKHAESTIKIRPV